MPEKIISKWWFYFLCIIMFFVPSIVQQPVSPENTALVIQEVMQKPLFHSMYSLFPLAKAFLLFLLIGGFIWKAKFARAFSALLIILFSFIAISQNISLNTKYGYAILLGNILLQAILVLSWVFECKTCGNDFSSLRLRWWNIVLFILAFIAYWMPAQNGQMHFSFADLFMNEAGLTYCMVTPVILSILLLYYPKLNTVTLRVTSFIGLIFAIINMITWFALNTAFWWMGIVHLPLLIISFVGLVLSKKIGGLCVVKKEERTHNF